MDVITSEQLFKKRKPLNHTKLLSLLRANEQLRSKYNKILCEAIENRDVEGQELLLKLLNNQQNDSLLIFEMLKNR